MADAKHTFTRWTFIGARSHTDSITGLKHQLPGVVVDDRIGPVATVHFGSPDHDNAVIGALIAASPDMHGALIEAAQATQEAFEEALRDVPEGSCIPPWIVKLQQAAERAHASLVKADDRFKATGSAQ